MFRCRWLENRDKGVSVVALSASQHRKAVREGKIDAHSKLKAHDLLSRGIDFVKAMSSGAASESVKIRRLKVCDACPSEQRYTENGNDYCRACRCPSWRFARLNLKAALAVDTCSLGYWREFN